MDYVTPFPVEERVGKYGSERWLIENLARLEHSRDPEQETPLHTLNDTEVLDNMITWARLVLTEAV